MKTLFRGKNFITLQEWNNEEINTLLEVSLDLKKKFAMGTITPYLSYQTIFLMFFEQSTRTRNSMEAGISQLGGHANYLDSSTMQISHGESAKDTAIILSSMVMLSLVEIVFGKKEISIYANLQNGLQPQ